MDNTYLGLDLSYTRTGWAVPELGLVGSLKSKPSDEKSDIQRAYEDIAGPLLDLLDTYSQISHIVVEGTVLRSFSASRSGILHGVVRGAIWSSHELPEIVVAPTSLKKRATGTGRATKQQMVEAANNNGYTGKNHDEADAWMLAIIMSQQ